MGKRREPDSSHRRLLVLPQTDTICKAAASGYGWTCSDHQRGRSTFGYDHRSAYRTASCCLAAEGDTNLCNRAFDSTPRSPRNGRRTEKASCNQEGSYATVERCCGAKSECIGWANHRPVLAVIRSRSAKKKGVVVSGVRAMDNSSTRGMDADWSSNSLHILVYAYTFHSSSLSVSLSRSPSAEKAGIVVVRVRARPWHHATAQANTS